MIKIETEKLQELLDLYKISVTEMANTQNRYDNKQDEETLKILSLAKYIVAELESKILNMYIAK